jgi:hypothetical protein
MEQKASSSNEEIANERNHEDSIMSIFDATANALNSQVHEQQVRERVDNFCGVPRHDIILPLSADTLVPNSKY